MVKSMLKKQTFSHYQVNKMSPEGKEIKTVVPKRKKGANRTLTFIVTPSQKEEVH